METACSTWLARAVIACCASCRSSGSFEFRTSSTVGLPTPCVTRLLISLTMSAGMISAACAWPSLTFAIASSRELTLIGSIDWNSWLAYLEMLICWLPKWSLPWPAGTASYSATFGLPGGLESANPIISAITIGYTTSSPTSNGERLRICRSLTNSQRIASVAVFVQEAHERGFEVAAERRRGTLAVASAGRLTARSSSAAVPVNSSSPSPRTRILPA